MLQLGLDPHELVRSFDESMMLELQDQDEDIQRIQESQLPQCGNQGAHRTQSCLVSHSSGVSMCSESSQLVSVSGHLQKLPAQKCKPEAERSVV